MKRTAFHFSALLACLILMASCASHKFTYSNAYYFKYYNYQKAKANQEPEKNKTTNFREAGPLLTSRENPTLPEMPDRIALAKQHLLEKLNLQKDEAKNIDKEALRDHVKSLSRSERKALIRDLKSEMKAFKSAESASVKKFDTQNVQRTSELRGYTRTGVIIGGIGVILLLLGGIFGVSVLTFVGVVGVLTGVVFILLDVL